MQEQEHGLHEGIAHTHRPGKHEVSNVVMYDKRSIPIAIADRDGASSLFPPVLLYRFHVYLVAIPLRLSSAHRRMLNYIASLLYATVNTERWTRRRSFAFTSPSYSPIYFDRPDISRKTTRSNDEENRRAISITRRG